MVVARRKEWGGSVISSHLRLLYWISEVIDKQSMRFSSMSRKWLPSLQAMDAGWIEFSARGSIFSLPLSSICRRVLSERITWVSRLRV